MEEPEERLTQESVDPDPALSALMARGAEYGNWWHELMQQLDWNDPSLRQKQFQQALHGCPDPVRGKEEWDLFQRSELVSRLMEADLVYHPEMPLLVFYEDHACLEGFMDLAVRFTGEGHWWVIDWKTDRVDSVGRAELVERYGAQIEAYMEALKKVTREPVEGFVYSTRLGALLPVR
jgi:ATP-dependent exoDNAse (exonuclease V) beta subunit